MVPSNSGTPVQVASINIILSGVAIPEDMPIISVEVEKNMGMAPNARIAITGKSTGDGLPADIWMLFMLDTAISIEAGYNGLNQTIFNGTITGHAVKLYADAGMVAEIICHDITEVRPDIEKDSELNPAGNINMSLAEKVIDTTLPALTIAYGKDLLEADLKVNSLLFTLNNPITDPDLESDATITGKIKTQGDAMFRAGVYVKLQGLGYSFDGDHLISGVVHHIVSGNWTSSISVGVKPPKVNSAEGISLKSGAGVHFDDKTHTLTVNTSFGNTIIMDDQNKKITVQDMNMNTITMAEYDISIKSYNDINLQAKGKINIQGDRGVYLQPGTEVEIDAINITQHATSTCSVNSDAAIHINGGIDLTLKAALININ